MVATFVPCKLSLEAASMPVAQVFADINVHKTPGSSRVGAGACPSGFVPQNHFADLGATAEDFKAMQIDWRDVSSRYFKSVQPNGLIKPDLYVAKTGTYDP